MTERERIRADGLLRALATAEAAVRLYPPASEIPRDAVRGFVALAETAMPPEEPTLRYVVDPDGFTSEYGKIASHPNIVALAEDLYAHQTGRLVFSQGVTEEEVFAFLTTLATDPGSIRQAGGIRAVLGGAGVTHIAVIEVTLRPSTEEGIAGLDLTSAPFEEIGAEVAAAAEHWAATASHGEGGDRLSSALEDLEDAARDLAAARIAEALLAMDERSRMRVLSHAMYRQSSGERMPGMSSVVARMKPAALARLLRLVAAQEGVDPAALAPSLDLPPQVLEMVMSLLSSEGRSEETCGVPAEVDTDSMNAEVVAEDAGERERLERDVRSSAATIAARGLRTTVALVRDTGTDEAVSAMAEAIGPALHEGCYDEVAVAMSLLRELADSPSGGQAVAFARQRAGESLLDAYLEADGERRRFLKPALTYALDAVMPRLGQRLKTVPTGQAVKLLEAVAAIGDRRTIPTLNLALEHLDRRVRQTALEALGSMGSPEGHRVLTKTVGHWDPQTRRWAVRIIGKTGVQEAVPVLLRVLQGYYLFERNYELKKEVIESLEALGSPKALPTLSRIARRRLVIGRKNRELQFLAKRATAGLERKAADAGEKAAPSETTMTTEGKMASGH